MKSTVLASLIICATSAHAGGDYFPVKITEFSNDVDAFHFSAEPTDERLWMDEMCSKIIVKGEYDSQRWFMYKKPMSFENHMLSIEFLKKSSKSNKKVYLGYIGGGLHKVKKCSYESKGLVYEKSKKEFVLSVYDRI